MTTIEPGFGPQAHTEVPGDAAAFSGLMAADVPNTGEDDDYRFCRDVLSDASAVFAEAERHKARGNADGAYASLQELSGILGYLIDHCGFALSDAEYAEVVNIKREVDRMLGAYRNGQGASDFLGAIGGFIGWVAGGVLSWFLRSPDAVY